ncbi:DsbA family oxidoreductase [Paenibacillus terrigena]|uniref:DsbA family oxidoreductase n=1 Tax=Paenibacillus terrigena TaxID=369333 RepID=UPI00036E0BF0|nr:DsbA family oxidoreductase [Paenibacillus terrigena]
MTVKIQVYSDFVCPFCYLGKKPFEEAIQGKDVEVEWMPFELRPSGSQPIDPWNEPSKLQGWNSYISPMAEKWGVDMKLPRLSPHPYTGLAFEGYHYAKEQGKGNAYMNRVFTAFYQEELNIGELEVLTELASSIGLDAENFRAALTSGKYKSVQDEARRHAYEEAAVTAVPTFIIGGQRIQGVTNRESFEKVLNEELAKDQGGLTIIPGLQCDVDGSCYDPS